MPRSRILPFKKPTVGQIMSGRHRTHPRYRGCVGHWIMAEGGGLTAFDASGYNNHGTLTNGPTWTTGQFGRALQLDGVNDYVDLSSFHPYTYQQFSFSIWYKSNIDTVTDDGYFWIHGNNSPIILIFSITDDSGEVDHPRMVLHRSGATIRYYYGTSDVVDRQWHHIVYVRSATRIRIYVDGKVELDTADLDAGFSLTPPSGFGPWMGDEPGNTEQINGLIDEPRLYNRAFSDEEVRSLYLRPFLEFEETHRRVYVFVPAAPGVGFDIFQRARMDGLGGRKSKDMSGL